MQRILALVLVLTLLPLRAYADPSPVVPIPPGEDHIEAIKKGDPSPYTGQVFENATAIRWGNFILQYKARLALDVEYQKKMDAADLDYQKKLVMLSEEKYTRVTKELQDKNAELTKQLADPPFYKSTWFGFALGALSMGVAVALSALAVSAAK